MNQGNKKNKIAIVGHTRGIGKAIADLYRKKKYTVVGLSSSNGYDLQCSQVEIMEQLDDCRLIVLNAYVGRGQMTLLKRIYGKYLFEDKKVVVITSTSGTPIGADEELYNAEYMDYCKNKKTLIGYIEELQQELLNKPLSVYDVCPDVVDTDMTKGLWEDLPKLKAVEVAEAVRYCFESTFNVNKIVMQKNVS
jgi:NAD(P)-dependent dehydrogenase (short-subunit alcohol dehydrogenase family)|tara:strand:- start:248 stop:826 length:579 start_codon:yes stop_codon:yes gene_type:complete